MRISMLKLARVFAASFCCLAGSYAAQAQTVLDFTVINSDNQASIATFQGSGTVSLGSNPRINVRANVVNVGSVVFTDGTSQRTENAAPYTYKSDGIPWQPSAGTYRISATPYSGANGSGKAGATQTLELALAAGTAPPISQDYVDHWVATDALGRTLPNHAQTGPKKDGKVVGVFYYIWAGAHGNQVHDISKIMKAYPSDPLSPNNPNWGGVTSFHWWGEPEYGYFRSDDPWVIQRDLNMLSNAKVDFLFLDVTNANIYLPTVMKLCDESKKLRDQGVNTPQIVFTTNSKSGETINALYDQFYKPGLCAEQWFSRGGKPLIFGQANDPVLRPEVKDFFTIKYSWAQTQTAVQPHHWQWLDNHPQDFGWWINPQTPEQLSVSTAHHPSNPHGKSFNNKQQPAVNADYLTGLSHQGLEFAQQWSRVFEVNPEVVMITQWNEWLAQRFIWDKGPGNYAGRPISNGYSHFVDVLNEEFNRDIAPMKGGYTDNYYYQMVSNIRKFKGMAPLPSFSTPKTIGIDGNFGDWSDVTPIFYDPRGERDLHEHDGSKRHHQHSGHLRQRQCLFSRYHGGPDNSLHRPELDALIHQFG
jgi:hypothetical protein